MDEALIVPTTHFHRRLGAEAMERLLAMPDPPDAVFCYNDLLALGAIRALIRAGRRIPEDVAVVGLDDIEEGQYSTPSLTTVAPDKGRSPAGRWTPCWSRSAAKWAHHPRSWCRTG